MAKCVKEMFGSQEEFLAVETKVTEAKTRDNEPHEQTIERAQVRAQATDYAKGNIIFMFNKVQSCMCVFRYFVRGTRASILISREVSRFQFQER